MSVRVTFEKLVSVELRTVTKGSGAMRVTKPIMTLPEIEEHGLTWSAKALDTKLQIKARRFPRESEHIFLGTLTEGPDHWSKILLSGARAGCKLHFSCIPGGLSIVKKNILQGVKSSLDITDGQLQTAIVGTRFRSPIARAVLDGLPLGTSLQLVPEPTNKFDRHALAVAKDDTVFGYVPKTDHPILNFILSKRGNKSSIFKTTLVNKLNNPAINVTWELS